MEQSAAAAESLKSQAQQLVQAVAVFKLGAHGAQAQPPSAAARASVVQPAKASAWNERRSADRAKNVSRPKFGARAQAPARAEAPTLTNAITAPERSGTDGEWTSF